MSQEENIRKIIADLAQEHNPISISPARLAGLLEMLLDFSSGAAVAIEENLREALNANRLPDNQQAFKTMSADQAVQIVKLNFK